MFASPHAPATGRRPCASSEDVGGLVDLVKDVVGQGGDVVVGVADIVSDWTGLPVDDVVRELVDLVEDNAPVVVAEFRRYAAAKLQDPEFWAQLAGHLTALVATGLHPLAEINRDTDEIKSFLQASTK